MRKEKDDNKNLEKIVEKDEKVKRTLHGWQRYLAFTVAVVLTLFTFATAFIGEQLPMIQRSLHVYCVLILVYFWYPGSKRAPRDRASIFDLVCIAFSLFSVVYVLLNSSRYANRVPYTSPVYKIDMVLAVGLVILCLEAGRRTLGLSITLIAGIFVAYAFWGKYLPGIFQYKGTTLKKFVEQIFMTTEGIFGSLTGMSATTLFSFIAFGAFLQATHADKYFMNICLALCGKKPGGPAKVSCLSSAMMGTISGSSIANVVTTGTLTIPIMKASGYKPEEAGAIETVASSGGQIMPPIMGTGAFILAEAVGVPYMTVVKVSIMPAIVYYLCLWFFIDAKAKKRGIKGMEVVPDVKESLKVGFPFFIPVLTLFGLLVLNFAPFLGAISCTLLIFAIAEMRKDTRINFKQFWLALESCAKGMTSITGVILCASIVISMINMTGLMMKSTQIILSISGGKLWLTILLCAVIAYILGMGLPISTCYVILSSLACAAMVKIGAPILCAHLMIFWFTQLAQITPPVCMTAFAGAAIAKADPMKTGWNALTYGITFYVIPIMFIYSKLITGTVPQVLLISVIAVFALFFMVSGFEGYLLGNLSVPGRAICFAIFIAAVAATFDATSSSLRIILLSGGAAAALLLILLQHRRKKAAATE